MWSAAVEPRVLTVRAVPVIGEPLGLDLHGAHVRLLKGSSCEHVVIDGGCELVRLDVVEGSIATRRVMLHFDLPDDECFEAKIAAIRTLRDPAPVGRMHRRQANRLIALHAVDVRDDGASLRETADRLFGPGDWPGDGEHRKSLVRRLIDAGYRMIRSGPREILSSR